MTEAQTISHIVVGPPAIGVGADHAGVGVAALLPGAVDVAVAKGEVLVLVLGVVLGAGHAGGSRPHLGNGGGPHGSNGPISSNSRGSHSPQSNSRGGNGPNSRGSNGSYRGQGSNSRGGDGSDGGNRGGGISPGIGVGVAKGGGPGSSIVGGVQSVSISLAAGKGGDGKNDLTDNDSLPHFCYQVVLTRTFIVANLCCPRLQRPVWWTFPEDFLLLYWKASECQPSAC